VEGHISLVSAKRVSGISGLAARGLSVEFALYSIAKHILTASEGLRFSVARL